VGRSVNLNFFFRGCTRGDMGYALVNLGRAIWMMGSVFTMLVAHGVQMAYNIGLSNPRLLAVQNVCI
jgi:hypothetical protein